MERFLRQAQDRLCASVGRCDERPPLPPNTLNAMKDLVGEERRALLPITTSSIDDTTGVVRRPRVS
jgi:hypothetical protein